MKKLNLGCGQFRKEGYINLDISPLSKADVICNLEKFPYPFDDNTFDLIEADHLLEHLIDPFLVMAELNRILKPGGNIHLHVPHFSRALTHPQHKSGFDVTFPLYFDKDAFGSYTGINLINKKMELHWFAQKYLMKKILKPWLYYILSIIGETLDVLAKLSPFFCSRVWCFWVGGFYEIEFVFQKPIE